MSDDQPANSKLTVQRTLQRIHITWDRFAPGCSGTLQWKTLGFNDERTTLSKVGHSSVDAELAPYQRNVPVLCSLKLYQDGHVLLHEFNWWPVLPTNLKPGRLTVQWGTGATTTVTLKLTELDTSVQEYYRWSELEIVLTQQTDDGRSVSVPVKDVSRGTLNRPLVMPIRLLAGTRAGQRVTCTLHLDGPLSQHLRTDHRTLGHSWPCDRVIKPVNKVEETAQAIAAAPSPLKAIVAAYEELATDQLQHLLLELQLSLKTLRSLYAESLPSDLGSIITAMLATYLPQLCEEASKYATDYQSQPLVETLQLIVRVANETGIDVITKNGSDVQQRALYKLGSDLSQTLSAWIDRIDAVIPLLSVCGHPGLLNTCVTTVRDGATDASKNALLRAASQIRSVPLEVVSWIVELIGEPTMQMAAVEAAANIVLGRNFNVEAYRNMLAHALIALCDTRPHSELLPSIADCVAAHGLRDVIDPLFRHLSNYSSHEVEVLLTLWRQVPDWRVYRLSEFRNWTTASHASFARLIPPWPEYDPLRNYARYGAEERECQSAYRDAQARLDRVHLALMAMEQPSLASDAERVRAGAKHTAALRLYNSFSTQKMHLKSEIQVQKSRLSELSAQAARTRRELVTLQRLRGANDLLPTEVLSIQSALSDITKQIAECEARLRDLHRQVKDLDRQLNDQRVEIGEAMQAVAAVRDEDHLAVNEMIEYQNLLQIRNDLQSERNDCVQALNEVGRALRDAEKAFLDEAAQQTMTTRLLSELMRS